MYVQCRHKKRGQYTVAAFLCVTSPGLFASWALMDLTQGVATVNFIMGDPLRKGAGFILVLSVMNITPHAWQSCKILIGPSLTLPVTGDTWRSRSKKSQT